MKLTAILLALFTVVLTVNAGAATSEGEQNEILFQPTSGLAFGGAGVGATTTPVVISTAPTSVITLGYNYQFMPGVMIGIRPSLTWTNSPASAVNFSFLAGPTINFPFTDKFDDAFYGFAGAGWAIAGGAASVSTFQMEVEVGKRFQIVEHLSYHPSVYWLKTTALNTYSTFGLNIFSFSAQF